jgi:hypothetical protein
MIVCHLHQLNSDKLITRDRPILAESDIEKKSIRIGLVRQSEKAFVTIQHAANFVTDICMQIDRLCFRRFVTNTCETQTFQQAGFVETERHKVSEDDLGFYLDAFTIHLQHVSLLLVWNEDETRIGITKKYRGSISSGSRLFCEISVAAAVAI